MLAKEEAVLLPFVLMAWLYLQNRTAAGERRLWAIVPFVIGSISAEALYFGLRARSGAFTPATAPPFYRLDFSLQRLAENVPAYLDRSGTFAAVVVLAWLAIAWPRLRDVRL